MKQKRFVPSSKIMLGFNQFDKKVWEKEFPPDKQEPLLCRPFGKTLVLLMIMAVWILNIWQLYILVTM